MSDIITVSSSDDECSPPPEKKIKPIFLGEITHHVTITRVNKKTGNSNSTNLIDLLSDEDDDDEIVDITSKSKDESCVLIEDDVENEKLVEDTNEEEDDCEVVDNGKFVKSSKGTEDIVDVIEGLKDIENVQVVEDCDESNESSQDDSDKEESSGKENKTEIDGHSSTSEPSTSGSNATDLNALLLAGFVTIFEGAIKSTKFEVLQSKISVLTKYYDKCKMELTDSQDFKQIVEVAINKAKKSTALAVIGFNEVFQYLKEIMDSESIEVTAEKRLKLKKLEKTIKLLMAKIKSLEEAEINFDDEEDSTYIQTDRYTNRLKKVHQKYCELLEKNPYSGRLTYSKLDFSDSEYNEINRAISKKYKNNKKFPSYIEMENFIQKISDENNLDLSSSKIKSESIHCFKKLGELLQNRRRRELYDSHYMLIEDGEDPAKNDPALDTTLTEQYAEGQKKIDKLVQDYVNKQQHGVEAELSDESSDKSNYVDSEEGDEMMQYEEENEKLADTSACAGVRADLKMCLLQTECCKERKKTPRECLKSHDPSVPLQCYVLRNTFFECKRSLLDARQRFRGRKGY